MEPRVVLGAWETLDQMVTQAVMVNKGHQERRARRVLTVMQEPQDQRGPREVVALQDREVLTGPLGSLVLRARTDRRDQREPLDQQVLTEPLGYQEQEVPLVQQVSKVQVVLQVPSAHEDPMVSVPQEPREVLDNPVL